MMEEPFAIVIQNANELRVGQGLLIKCLAVLAAQHIIVQVKQPIRQLRYFVGIQPQHTAGREPGGHIGDWQLLVKQVGDIDFSHIAARSLLTDQMIQEGRLLVSQGPILVIGDGHLRRQNVDVQRCRDIF